MTIVTITIWDDGRIEASVQNPPEPGGRSPAVGIANAMLDFVGPYLKKEKETEPPEGDA